MTHNTALSYYKEPTANSNGFSRLGVNAFVICSGY